MRISVRRPAVVAAALTVAAGIAFGAFALRPAVASDGTIHVGPYVLVTCNHPNPNPCQQYRNTGTGIGVEGDAAHGTGVKGTANNNGSIGVAGFGGNAGIAVKGLASNSNGVEGDSNAGSGVYGSSQSGLGVYGVSNSSVGVLGDSSGPEGGFFDDFASGYGVEVLGGATGSSSVFAQSRGGVAGYFDSATNGTNYGIVSYSFGLPTVWTSNGNGNGGELNGSYIGLVSRAPAGGSTYPLVLTDSSAANLFYVDGNGNVFYHGTLNTFLRTHNGATTKAYGSVSTSPTVDDNGTAQLVNGAAFVRLDPAFADSIDTNKAYQVMLTPDGDTRGLFVASKSPTGFVVREMQGGRGSISFDYHIYAPALGRSNDRMTYVNPASAGPKAPIVRPAVQKATRPPIPGK